MAVNSDGRRLADSQVAPLTLRCLECEESSSGGARGWRALLSGAYEGEEGEVGIFCPDCFAREFGDALN